MKLYKFDRIVAHRIFMRGSPHPLYKYQILLAIASAYNKAWFLDRRWAGVKRSHPHIPHQ
jgi:hypothetical protein